MTTSELGLFQVVQSVTDNPWLFILMLIASQLQDDCYGSKFHICFQGRDKGKMVVPELSPLVLVSFTRKRNIFSRRSQMSPMVQSCFPWPPLVFREVEQVAVGLSHLYSGGSKGRRKQPTRSVRGRMLNRKEVEAATVKHGTVLARVTSQSCPGSWAMLAFSQGWELENRLPGGNL